MTGVHDQAAVGANSGDEPRGSSDVALTRVM